MKSQNRLLWIATTAVALVLVGLIAAYATFRLAGTATAYGVPDIGGPFELVDGGGKPVTDQSYRGKWLLVYFGYTFCPDACPTTLTAIADLMPKLGSQADKVQPLFITIDPRRDTQTVMANYVKAFDPRIVGLTGSAEQIAAAAKRYRVYYAVHKTGDGPDDYLMDHSTILYVMDPTGKFVTTLPADMPGDQMAERLRPLMAHTS